MSKLPRIQIWASAVLKMYTVKIHYAGDFISDMRRKWAKLKRKYLLRLTLKKSEICIDSLGNGGWRICHSSSTKSFNLKYVPAEFVNQNGWIAIHAFSPPCRAINSDPLTVSMAWGLLLAHLTQHQIYKIEAPTVRSTSTDHNFNVILYCNGLARGYQNFLKRIKIINWFYTIQYTSTLLVLQGICNTLSGRIEGKWSLN